MYTLKSIARRSVTLGAAFAIVASTVVPAASAFAANALNPLTERSLLLSSSAPGFQDTDGSGYSTTAPNPAAGGNVLGTYAPAGTGPNGKKSGQTFTFRTSSAETVRAYTFQFCTTAAGLCQAPGNNTGDARPTPNDRQVNDGVGGGWEAKTSDFDVTGSFAQATAAAPTAGQYQITIGDSNTPTAASNWTLTAENLEDQTFAHPDNARLTGKNNFMTLRSTTGDAIPAGARVKIEFKASETAYITNPGNGSFFVKINTYKDGSATGQLPDTDANIVDGGVTVANVMTDSIHITTKVLETMAFSVGTKNPDTVVKATANDHGTCESIIQEDNNRLDLGNPSAENSLETGRGWDVNSYWRLSSNSSGGATVYYSGNTLANTVGDEIAPMTTKARSQPGTEQFGLGFIDANLDTLSSSFNDALALTDSRYKRPSSYPFITVAGQSAVTNPGFDQLAGQPISDDYADAAGTLDNGTGGQGSAQFKFVKASNTVPEPIAQQNQQVISCATAKMRYVGNIGADTPAGVYTTKINYLAAPQY
ncbi:MAG: hypothetical protein EOP77_04110 [Variovorax sp.]|nr:MAG: hypothetical protein EOP77_04110 [Variovorax sp.]